MNNQKLVGRQKKVSLSLLLGEETESNYSNARASLMVLLVTGCHRPTTLVSYTQERLPETPT